MNNRDEKDQEKLNMLEKMNNDVQSKLTKLNNNENVRMAINNSKDEVKNIAKNDSITKKKLLEKLNHISELKRKKIESMSKKEAKADAKADTKADAKADAFEKIETDKLSKNHKKISEKDKIAHEEKMKQINAYKQKAIEKIKKKNEEKRRSIVSDSINAKRSLVNKYNNKEGNENILLENKESIKEENENILPENKESIKEDNTLIDVLNINSIPINCIGEIAKSAQNETVKSCINNISNEPLNENSSEEILQAIEKLKKMKSEMQVKYDARIKDRKKSKLSTDKLCVNNQISSDCMNNKLIIQANKKINDIATNGIHKLKEDVKCINIQDVDNNAFLKLGSLNAEDINCIQINDTNKSDIINLDSIKKDEIKCLDIINSKNNDLLPTITVMKTNSTNIENQSITENDKVIILFILFVLFVSITNDQFRFILYNGIATTFKICYINK